MALAFHQKSPSEIHRQETNERNPREFPFENQENPIRSLENSINFFKSEENALGFEPKKQNDSFLDKEDSLQLSRNQSNQDEGLQNPNSSSGFARENNNRSESHNGVGSVSSPPPENSESHQLSAHSMDDDPTQVDLLQTHMRRIKFWNKRLMIWVWGSKTLLCFLIVLKFLFVSWGFSNAFESCDNDSLAWLVFTVFLEFFSLVFFVFALVFIWMSARARDAQEFQRKFQNSLKNMFIFRAAHYL